MIFDQIGRATFQFSVVVSAILTVFDAILMVVGINPPAFMAIPFMNSSAMLASIHSSGFVLYAIAVFAITAGTFLWNSATIYVKFFYFLGIAAGQAFGFPGLAYIGATVGGVLQVFMYWYVIVLMYNYASQSPFFTSNL